MNDVTRVVSTMFGIIIFVILLKFAKNFNSIASTSTTVLQNQIVALQGGGSTNGNAPPIFNG